MDVGGGEFLVFNCFMALALALAAKPCKAMVRFTAHYAIGCVQ